MDRSILLVDDSLAMRMTVRNILTSIGYNRIAMAGSGREGISKLNEAVTAAQPFHIVFLDWNMPEMDGLEFLKTCRAEPVHNDTAIVMLTAVSDQRSVITALENGATSYITKPVSTETMAKKLEQVTGWLRKHAR